MDRSAEETIQRPSTERGGVFGTCQPLMRKIAWPIPRRQSSSRYLRRILGLVRMLIAVKERMGRPRRGASCNPNRIGHCRRPHPDYFARLEQTRRDLYTGVLSATAAFNRQFEADENWKDAVVDGWVRVHHSSPGLVEHAHGQYNTVFQLRYSRRPWVKSAIDQETVSGIPGYIWHAHWIYRGGKGINLRRFWRNIGYYHNTILMLCADTPSSIEVSFPAMDDPQTIADAIGECFHAVLRNIGFGSASEDFDGWRERHADIDPRVQVGTPWAMIDDSIQQW